MQVLSITPLLLIEPSTMMEKDLSHTQTLISIWDQEKVQQTNRVNLLCIRLLALKRSIMNPTDLGQIRHLVQILFYSQS